MSLRVLIVDDEVWIREILRRALEASEWENAPDYELDTAENGGEALAKHAAAPFDLFLVDINMPGMSGIELVRALDPKNKPIAVIVVSAQQNFHQAQEIIGAGAFDYVLKPFDIEALRNTVKKAAQSISERIVEKTDKKVLNLVRHNLLSIVAHEMRTPLTAMVSDLFVLEKALVGAPAEVFTNMREAFVALSSSVNKLVKVALFSDPHAPVEIRPFNLGAALESLGRKFKPQAAQKNVTLCTEMLLESPMVRTDGEKLVLAMEHLVDNAVKFGRQNGNVRVTVKREGPWVAVCVTDDGEGVPPGLVPGLFTEFVQAEEALTRRHGGMGVGLFLVKRAMELLSGKIEVESEPGKGSRFKLLVPELIAAATT